MEEPNNQPSAGVAAEAMALLEAGRHADALAYLLALPSRDSPALRRPVLELFYRALYLQRCIAEVADAAATWLAQRPHDFDVLYLYVSAHSLLNEMPQARETYPRLLGLASSPDQIAQLLPLVPRLHQGRARFLACQALLAKLDQMAPLPRQSLSALAARSALMLAMGDMAEFKGLLGSARAAGVGHDRFGELFRIDDRLRKFEASNDCGAGKVFCIGLSKTGTTSLHAALTILGLHSAHWINPVTGNLLDDADIPLFDALGDTPISCRFEELYFTYPRARFIYTHREFSTWEKSLLTHYAAHHRQRDLQTFESMATPYRRGEEIEYGHEALKISSSLYFNHSSLLSAHTSFDRRVRSFFADRPTARFLVLDIIGGQGWAELCEFLHLPVPGQPFPWQYKTRLKR